jgi:hypothetical protein
MSSSELESIHAAVAAGHPWAQGALDRLQAQETEDALIEEERENVLAATRIDFEEMAGMLDEAEAAVQQFSGISPEMEETESDVEETYEHESTTYEHE